MVPLKVRKRLIEYAGGLSLVEPGNVATPDSMSPPIEGIAVLDGCRCITCGSVCPGQDSMVTHCRTQHNWAKAQGMGWEARKVQTVFQGIHKKYFVVTLDAIEPPRESVDEWIDSLL